MNNYTKERLIVLFLEIEKAIAMQVAQKTETAYKFMLFASNELTQQQRKLLRYAIVHKVKDSNGEHYTVHARYDGNEITVTALTYTQAKTLLINTINGVRQ